MFFEARSKDLGASIVSLSTRHISVYNCRNKPDTHTPTPLKIFYLWTERIAGGEENKNYTQVVLTWIGQASLTLES